MSNPSAATQALQETLAEFAEPTLREKTIHMIERAAIDLEYARKQLQRAQAAGLSRGAMLDCLSRAQDALDRVADAQAGMILTLVNVQLEPPAEAQEWTSDEILAREG